MSKRLSFALIIICTLLSAVLLAFAQTQVVSPKENPLITLSPKSPIEKKKFQKQLTIAPTVPPSPPSFSLLAVGDIMLDRSVLLKTQAANDWNHPFLLIDLLLKQYDLRVANLEGPITNFKSIANGTGGARFAFTFSPNFVEPLKKFQFLSLANNHAHNFGEKGLAQTSQFLGDANITYFGGPNNVPGQISVTSSYNGITFAFVGYHQLVERGLENVIAEIKKLDPVTDVVIAVPHWGPEYQTDKPSPAQTRDAHALIDAGADLILGAHPHVVQPLEIYQDRVIFYSLGNFIFDQYFSEETMTGLAVGIKIEKREGQVKIEYHLIPLDINKQSQPSVASEPKKGRVLNHLQKFSSLGTEDVLDGVFSGEL